MRNGLGPVGSGVAVSGKPFFTSNFCVGYSGNVALHDGFRDP